MTDRIEKTIDLRTPLARSWRALSDSTEFGAWFRVSVDGPFVVGETVRGNITHPGYEHLTWQAQIVRMDAPHAFAFRWHPYAIDPNRDYSSEPSTLVELTLEAIPSGTRLTVVESGFDALPPERRDEAFRMNEGGWTQQMQNVRAHVDG